MKGDFSRRTFRPHRRYVGVLQQQGRVALDADWNEQVEIDRHQGQALVRDLVGACGGPRDDAGFEIRPSEDGKGLLIGAGRYYVGGLLAVSHASCAFAEQPDVPSAGRQLADAATKPGRYLAYLDVWERLVTAVEDPDLLDPALGGADTTVRLKTVWQVRLREIRGGRSPMGCDEAGSEEGRPVIDARAPESGYAGLEHRLYLVEIHDAGRAGATFKWSRQNGSVVVPLRRADRSTITLDWSRANLPLPIEPGAWLELLDDALELDGLTGQLLQVAAVDEASGTVELSGDAQPLAETESGVEPRLHPKARRWDGVGEARAGSWIALEDGIEVAFSDQKGTLRSGHHWIFAARPADRSIDWTGPQAASRVEHYCCPLTLLEVDARRGGWRLLRDRRRLFRPLARA
jgi:hypothetical protein